MFICLLNPPKLWICTDAAKDPESASLGSPRLVPNFCGVVSLSVFKFDQIMTASRRQAVPYYMQPRD